MYAYIEIKILYVGRFPYEKHNVRIYKLVKLIEILQNIKLNRKECLLQFITWSFFKDI